VVRQAHQPSEAYRGIHAEPVEVWLKKSVKLTALVELWVTLCLPWTMENTT
jgi:hypothetical protein